MKKEDLTFIGSYHPENGGQPLARFRHQLTGIIFHLIPGGIFNMGSSERELKLMQLRGYNGDGEESPQRRLEIQPFLLAEFPCTVAQWKAGNGLPLRRENAPDEPADGLDRRPAEMWCEDLGMRLPSEAEWEYACRAGTETIFFWGDREDERYCWMENSLKNGGRYYHTLQEHDTFRNAFGLVDMLGHVGEWVEDDYADYITLDEDPRPYHAGRKSANGILRGGWVQYGWKLNRCATRVVCAPDSGDTGCSFRPAADVPEGLKSQDHIDQSFM